MDHKPESNREETVGNDKNDLPKEVENSRQNSNSAGVKDIPKKSNNINCDGMNSAAHSPTMTIPASPPKYVSLDQLAEAANALCDMTLAHEITVDSNFKIEKYDDAENKLYKTVKETVHKAFWDILRQELNSEPPVFDQAIRLLIEIKETLLKLLLSTQSRMYDHINAKLNIDAARAQLQDTGSISIEGYGKIVIDLMAQMCAPSRDEQVASLREIDDPVELFREGFLVLEAMQMDMANYTISQMRPVLKKQVVQYERAKFAEYLEAQKKLGFDGLQLTRSWISSSYEQLFMSMNNGMKPSTVKRPSAEDMQNGAAQESSNLNIPVPNLILADAYVSLLKWEDESTFPETILVDYARIQKASQRLLKLVCVASLILSACNVTLKQLQTHLSASQMFQVNSTNMIEQLKLRLCQNCRKIIASGSKSTTLKAFKKELQALTDVLTFRIQCDVKEWLQQNADLFNQDTIKSFVPQLDMEIADQVSGVLAFSHPVYNLLYNRGAEFLRLTFTSMAPKNIQLPGGFGVFAQANSSPVAPDRPMTGLNKVPFSPRSKDEELEPSDDQSDNIDKISSFLLTLFTHNRTVFGQHYAEIVQKLLYSDSPRPSVVVPPSPNVSS